MFKKVILNNKILYKYINKRNMQFSDFNWLNVSLICLFHLLIYIIIIF